jgi:hypothetical protein
MPMRGMGFAYSLNDSRVSVVRMATRIGLIKPSLEVITLFSNKQLHSSS